jgi:hypothetical protein
VLLSLSLSLPLLHFGFYHGKIKKPENGRKKVKNARKRETENLVCIFLTLTKKSLDDVMEMEREREKILSPLCVK